MAAHHHQITAVALPTVRICLSEGDGYSLSNINRWQRYLRHESHDNIYIHIYITVETIELCNLVTYEQIKPETSVQQSSNRKIDWNTALLATHYSSSDINIATWTFFNTDSSVYQTQSKNSSVSLFSLVTCMYKTMSLTADNERWLQAVSLCVATCMYKTMRADCRQWPLTASSFSLCLSTSMYKTMRADCWQWALTATASSFSLCMYKTMRADCKAMFTLKDTVVNIYEIKQTNKRSLTRFTWHQLKTFRKQN